MTDHGDRLDSEIAREMAACRAGVPEAADTEPSLDDLAPLGRRVEEELAREVTGVATLRALRTPYRVLLVLAALALVVLLAVAVAPRADLASYPRGRMALSIVLLSAVAAVASWRLLRPLHLPPPPLWSSRLLLIAGVTLPCVLAALPLDHAGANAGTGAGFAVGCGKCLAFGGALGFPALLLALLLRRAPVDGAAVSALGGVAAGLAANVALGLHCPVSDPAHIVSGHALLVVLLGGVAASWQR
jgi:hypothetical protein